MQQRTLAQPGVETLPRRRHVQLCLAILAGLSVYVLSYLLWFVGSPLGRYPLLDSAENLSLARQIAEGTLPPIPFFRAMLYPATLSIFLRIGVTADSLPVVAGLFGCLCHLVSTFFVYRIARRGWASPRAGLWAAVLFGFNPVAVYFAAEPLDTTFGLCLFLAGLNLLHSRWPALRKANSLGAGDAKRLVLDLAAVGALWALAMLARPHYAIVLAGVPFLLAACLWRTPRLLLPGAGALVLAAGFLLCLAGFWQQHVTGEFRIMPTQGAYSLWAGNRPGANGRYFEQKIHLPAGDTIEGDNPARIESQVLYQRETGTTGPVNAQAEMQYWRQKTLDSIKSNPGAWLGLMAKKVYFVLNNFEQYNNKTYAVQKALSPVLKPNPLGWGVTLVLCTAGLVLMWRPDRRFRGGILAVAVAALYAGGVVLFFVSDRFRLPLLPFLCLGAGVWGLASFDQLRKLVTARMVPVGAVVLVVSAVTFSRGFGVHDLTPAVQDYVALSIACGKAGNDLDSLQWARKALACRPDHADALACAVNGFFNCRLRGIDLGGAFADETWELQVTRVGQIPQPAPSIRLVQAVALWKSGRPEEARKALHALSRSAPNSTTAVKATMTDDALGVLLLAGLQEPADEARARSRVGETGSFYLLAALARRENPDQPLIPAARRGMVSELAPFVSQIFP